MINTGSAVIISSFSTHAIDFDDRLSEYYIHRYQVFKWMAQFPGFFCFFFQGRWIFQSDWPGMMAPSERLKHIEIINSRRQFDENLQFSLCLEIVSAVRL